MRIPPFKDGWSGREGGRRALPCVRSKLIAALRMLETKRDTNPPKKHGNIPL